MVRIKLDKALVDQAIFSVEEFVEDIFSKFINHNSAFGISETLTLEELGKSIESELTSRISILIVFKHSQHFTIKNYEKIHTSNK